MLTLAVYQTDKPQYKFFDAQTETLFKKLTAKLPATTWPCRVEPR